ncbi:MAG: hypothetical protein PSV18_03590, partial [Methylobacter sp.]|nr:hypothetical protein [Candidatus Methylobacter titanis]
SIAQPASKTDFAILVFARPEALTLPTTIKRFSLTILGEFVDRILTGVLNLGMNRFNPFFIPSPLR